MLPVQRKAVLRHHHHNNDQELPDRAPPSNSKATRSPRQRRRKRSRSVLSRVFPFLSRHRTLQGSPVLHGNKSHSKKKGLHPVTAAIAMIILVFFFRYLALSVVIPNMSSSPTSEILSQLRGQKDVGQGIFQKHGTAKGRLWFGRSSTVNNNVLNLPIIIPRLEKRGTRDDDSLEFHEPDDDQFDAMMEAFFQSKFDPDFGGLTIAFYEEEEMVTRHIFKDMRARETHFRRPGLEPDDDMDEYYFMDDDNLRGLPVNFDRHNVHDDDKKCRRVSDHRLNFPSCNVFHELDRLEPQTNLTYINKGAFREVFAVSHKSPEATERIVVKDILYNSDSELYEDFEYVRMDAIVAERLTASPRIYDIYGHCGLGIMSEFFFHRDIEKDTMKMDTDGYMQKEDLHDELKVKPQNKLSGIQKLVLALQMAEALADLHGHTNNLIIHDDVQMSQYLFNKDKTLLKLNDFNRAEMPLFDEENGQYCRYKNGRGHGNWRSPEEYKNEPLTEKIDIWSLGCNMYGLLTGLNPLYHIESGKEFREKIKDGVVPYIDPRYRTRSPGEDLLSDIILKAFTYKAKDRPSIFEIVEMLEKAVTATLGPGVTKEEVLESVATLK